MTITDNFSLPSSPSALSAHADGKPTFIGFIAAKDPTTDQPWCPDVRAALPVLEKVFSGADGRDVSYVSVAREE